MSQTIKRPEAYSHFFRFTGQIINAVHTENAETFGPILVFSKPATQENPRGEEFGVTREHLLDIYKAATALPNKSKNTQQAIWVMEDALLSAWRHAGGQIIENNRDATISHILQKGFEPLTRRPVPA